MLCPVSFLLKIGRLLLCFVPFLLKSGRWNGRNGPLDVGYRHDVGEHAGRRDASSCTIALDEHGILLIARGGEQHDVVAAGQLIERVATGHGLQGHRRFLPVHRGHEAPTLAFALELPASGFKFGIQLG